MGLLDDLLSSVVAGQAAGQQVGRPTQQQSSGDMSRVMMALLPVVIAMMARRGGSPSQSGGGASMGGLGGLLGSLFGASGGTGGLGDLLAQFQRAGLGAEAQSWVSRGQNQPLSTDGLEKVFGRDVLAQIARHAGVSEADASRGLSQLLPEVVDRVTPDGKVPPDNELLAGVEAFARRYGVS
jgi:uncharacterized protein YidB (DUF937 family)